MIDLALVRQHLNIIDNHDDMYIMQLIQIAEHTLETELNINLCDIDLRHEDIVKMCVLQLVAQLYLYRESASVNDIKNTRVFEYLKGLVKNYTVNSFG
jgi:aspartate carbamoyltransferase regulatory subunit